VKWRDELLAQLEFYWNYHLWPRLRGLTDEEYFWEPVPGCWSIRKQPDGVFQIDWAWPTPDPPPVTTIAWRLAHMGVQTLGIRASSHFGNGALNLETVKWPGSAAEALRGLATHYEHWRRGVRSLDEDALLAPVGDAEGEWAAEPFANLILHLNREIMHHGGEIGVLRDLYRAMRRPAVAVPQ
jgi:hypothetical protein